MLKLLEKSRQGTFPGTFFFFLFSNLSTTFKNLDQKMTNYAQKKGFFFCMKITFFFCLFWPKFSKILPKLKLKNNNNKQNKTKQKKKKKPQKQKKKNQKKTKKTVPGVVS